MKRNLVTRPWEGWQLQMQDSKIKGVRSIGIISTPIVWPVKQRPTSSEKSTTSKFPINFWLMTTPSIWTPSTNHRITTMVTTGDEVTTEDKSTNKAFSSNVSAKLLNVSSKWSSLLFGEDEVSKMETGGSGSEDERYNVSVKEPDNISFSRTQLSNTNNHKLNQTWWPQWILHNFENFTPPLNGKSIVKHSNEDSKMTSEIFFSDHASGNHNPKAENTSLPHVSSDKSKNITGKLSFLINNSYTLTSVVTPTEDYFKSGRANKGLERLLGLPTPTIYGANPLKNTEEAKNLLETNVSVATESPADRQSTQPNYLTPPILRNQVMHSVDTQNILFTESVLCDIVSSCTTIYNILPTQSKLLLGSLLAQRANIHHVSINNMQAPLYPTQSMAEQISPTRTLGHEELFSTVLHLDGLPSNRQTINFPETENIDILNSRREEDYNLMTSSYDVSDHQWKYFILNYETSNDNLELYMGGPTTELPFKTSSSEIVSPCPTTEINEFQKNVDTVEFSGEEDFLEAEKLYLVSRSRIVESNAAREGISFMNTNFNLAPTKTLLNYLPSEFVVQSLDNDSFISNTTSNYLGMGSLENMTQLKLSNLLSISDGRPVGESDISSSMKGHFFQHSIASQKSSAESSKIKLVPCTIQDLINPNQQQQQENVHPEFTKLQGILHTKDIEYQASEISILTANSGFNDDSLKLTKTESLEEGYSSHTATPPLAYDYLSLTSQTHLMHNGHQLSTTTMLPSSNTKTQINADAAQISLLTTSSIINTVWNYGKITSVSEVPGRSFSIFGYSEQTEVLTNMEIKPVSTSFGSVTLEFSDSELKELMKENYFAPGTGVSHQSTLQEDYFNNTTQKLVSKGSSDASTLAPPILLCSCSHLSDVTCFCGQEVNSSM